MERKTFEVAGLAPVNCSTPTELRDEIILLSWLIVLLRMQESSQVNFEWQYQGCENGLDGDSVKSLSPSEVMIGLQSHVGQVAATFAERIPSITTTQQATSASPAALRLSTGVLSRTSEAATDEVSNGVVHLVSN